MGWPGLALSFGLGLIVGLGVDARSRPSQPPVNASRATETGTTTSLAAPERCPCPDGPRKARASIARPHPPPLPRSQSQHEAMGRALRARVVSALAACAPRRGDEIRLHLELKVTSEGRVGETRVVNAVRPPPTVESCAREALAELALPSSIEPPSAPVLFSLSVLL
ncbi:MAG: hypothetical protein AAFU79_08195 [Myxococcota bacterium]